MRRAAWAAAVRRGGRAGGGVRRVSHSARAGLVLPVARVRNAMRTGPTRGMRLSAGGLQHGMHAHACHWHPCSDLFYTSSLTFVFRLQKSHTFNLSRCSCYAGAPIFLTAVLEYLTVGAFAGGPLPAFESTPALAFSFAIHLLEGIAVQSR